MANYKDKKKLIDDNPDVYISDYDKNLDYSYLSDIIDQKKAYSAAEKAGDASAMKKANDRANSIRLQAGSYTAGSDGSKYNRVKRPYEAEEYSYPDNYYSSERKRLYKKLDKYPEFSYIPENDPVYNAYKEIYLALGDDAYKRALTDGALRTDGITNTSAMSAATFARNKYNSMLAAKVPELYRNAYEKYRSGKEDIYDQLEAIWKSEDMDYRKYRDDVEDYKDNRDYYYEKDKAINDDLQEMYKDENEREYQTSRDAVKDAQDTRDYNFESQKHTDNINLETQKHNDTMNFNALKHNDSMALNRQIQADNAANDRQALANEAAYNSQKLENDEKSDKYNIAVKVAKVLYGDVPITTEQFNGILKMLE